MIFQLIDDLTIYKKPWSDLSVEEQNKFNVFALHRLLSLDRDLIEVVGYVQKYYNIPPNIIYNFWLNILPKNKMYFKFLKRKENSKNTLYEILAKFYKMSVSEIKEYIPFFSNDDIEKILYGMGYNKKEIKKLLNGK